MNIIISKGTSSMLLLSLIVMSVLPQVVHAQEYKNIATDASQQIEKDLVPTSNNSDRVSKKEVKNAVRSLSGLTDDSDSVVVQKDEDSAMILDTDFFDADIPKSADDAVEIEVGNYELDVILPASQNTAQAKKVAKGVVAYPSSSGFANAVQAHEDGGVRMLTIIDTDTAPTEYVYDIDLPEGGIVELDDDGGAMIIDEDDNIVAIIEEPWAKDANEDLVETWFTTDGRTLIQHVNHIKEGVAYPVVADPAWFAAVAAVFSWATGMCATNVISSFSEDALYWALKKKDWYWKQQVNEAIGDCAWGVLWGGTGGIVISKFIPRKVRKKMWERGKNAKFYKKLKKKIRKKVKKTL